MQWNSGPRAGFTTAEPWIGVNPDYTTINATAEESDPNSVLNFTRSMIRFRKEHLSLVYGSFELLARDDPHLFAFAREGEAGEGATTKNSAPGGRERLLVEINMSGESVRSVAPESGATVLISNLDKAAALQAGGARAVAALQTGGAHAGATSAAAQAAAHAGTAPSRTLAPWEARISALI